MTVTLRDAEVADAADVTRIYVGSWNAAFSDHLPVRACTDEEVERWARDLAGAVRWRVAVESDLIVGFAGVGTSRDPVEPGLGELDTIAVSPADWRRGVGSALMDDALASMRALDFTSAVLWTLADYPAGDAFYRRFGWVPDGHDRDSGRQISYRHPLGVGRTFDQGRV